MKSSEQPRIELTKANACVEGMRTSKSLDEFEEYWKSFLHRIERVWNKTLSHYSKSPKWNGWKSKYDQIRKKDPLLSYLINARGADEHTVNEIVSREPGGIGINAAEGNSLFIEEMTINKGLVSIKSPQKIRVDFIPAKTILVTVINRGRKYPVPTSHLGKAIDPTKVLDISEVAVNFYQELLDDAEAYFVK
jgi:hypothetical protein